MTIPRQLKVLFAWEMGGNLGHVAKYLPTLRLLKSRKHDVLFATRDLELAQRLLGPIGIAQVQAPLVTRFKNRIREPTSFADILAEMGFVDPDALTGLVSGWRGLFSLYKPDVLVAEYAPAAQFAARLFRLPCLNLSTGFEHPPDLQPFPLFRPWVKLSPEDRLKKEEFLLANVNAMLSRRGIPPLGRLQEVLKTDLSLLTTLPELDHYGTRQGTNYVGPMFTQTDGLAANWSASPEPRVFVYLRPSPELPQMLKVLRASNAQVLATVPGIRRETAATYSSERFRILGEPLKLESLFPEMDLAITHGGQGLAGACLLHGVPMLTVPTNIEQHMMSNRLVELGVGTQITRNQVESDFASAVTHMLTDPRFRQQACLIAERYSGYDAAQLVVGVANTIERLAQRGCASLRSSSPQAEHRRSTGHPSGPAFGGSAVGGNGLCGEDTRSRDGDGHAQLATSPELNGGGDKRSC